MPKLCTIDGCVKAHKARGLCATHYNQTLPNRHRKVTLPCDACGGPSIKEARARRYANTYCSELCRDYDRWGPLTSEIPSGHASRWIGQTCTWAPPVTFNCAWCDTEATRTGNRDTYCTDPCRFRAKRARRRGRVHGATGTYTWGQVVRLWVAFGKACAYCRTSTELADIQAEHVIALARGGTNNLGNILPSCAPCNSDKRDLTMNQWSADRARRNLPPVITTWTRGDTRYAHLSWEPLHLAA